MSRRRTGSRRTRCVTAIVAALALVVGCTDGASDPGSEPNRRRELGELTSAPLSEATRAWWSYERAAKFDVLTTSIKVPMRDATTIGCDLSRPATDGAAAPGTFPGLVVEFTPYATLVAAYNHEAAFFVRRGYNALVCTIRGTGPSGGTWQRAMSSQDGRDAHDLVEWLAHQQWSNGRIGQFGESYGGATSYGAAVERAPHLRAIAPLQPPGNLYDDVVYPGGIKATERGTIDNWPPIAENLSGGGIDADDEYATNRRHPTFDRYWRDHSLVGRHGSINVPVLAVGGWNDNYFRSGTLANIEAAPGRTWMIYGPWSHTFPVDLGCDPCPGDALPAGVLLAWFDHWVKRVPDVPVPPRPTIVSFEGPKDDGAGWRELSHWDPTGADATTFVLSDDGVLARRPTASGTVTFHEPAEPGSRDSSATFTSATLDDDRVLVGHSTLDVRATLSAPVANVYVELIDVGPNGGESVVNDGFLKATTRDPGAATSYRVPVRADHHRFPAGHRIRLRVSGGSADALVPARAPVDVAITTGRPSTLRLPLAR